MPLTWKPKDYMKRGVRFLLEHNSAGLLWDPGLSKTATTLAAITMLMEEEMVERALVIAPLRVCHGVWPAEGEKWEDFNPLRIRVLHGPNKEDLLREPHDISVINPEGLEWLLGCTTARGDYVPGAMDGLDWFWDMLVLDESTAFKHTDTVRFKTLKPKLRDFRRRVILTGTPAPNGLMDLFGQIYVLDRGAALSPYITHYRREFFHPTGYHGKHWIPKKDAARQIQRRIAPLTMRLEARDYLQLPELVVPPPIRVDLPPAARRQYDQMEQLLMAAVDERLITAANAAASSGKCRQIANGGLYDEEQHALFIHDAKVDALEELVGELAGKPALIAYEFKHDLERLRRRAMFKNAPHIGGGVSTKAAAEAIRAWNAGELRVLLAQPQSTSKGLNLQGVGGAAVIWFAIPWDLEAYEQFYRRVWRQGQTERVFMYHLLARATVDEIVMKALGTKDRTQRALLTGLRDYTREREAKRGAVGALKLRRRRA